MPSRHSIATLVLALTFLIVVPANAAGPASATSTPSTSLASSDNNQSSTTDDFVSDLDNGTGLTPSRGRSGVEQAKRGQDSRAATLRSFAATPSAVASEPLATYHVSGIVQRATPVGQRPYDGFPLVPGITDSTGVRMFFLAGDPILYNHPVGQASLSMAYLDHYRTTGRTVYLQLAEANAQRLIDRRVESRGGWYYPYDFDFAVHGDTSQTLKAPWYSGMAQGMALSAFTRLFDVTHDPAWKTAADATFVSLNTGPVAGQPFGTWVSSTGDLWLEEYPRWPVENSERVLNGHIYAAFGLYDYAQLTGSADAKRLYDGALTTVSRYLMSEYRTPLWASKYSLRHRLPTTSYHQKHVQQMLYLQHQTGNPIYTSWATRLRTDFPERTSAGLGVITPATTVIYQLNWATRKVVRTKVVKFARTTAAPVDRRERAFGGPIMLRVSSGPYTDWWFPEAYSKARIRGAVDVHSYDPALQATFASGTSFIAYKYDSLNRLVSYKRLTFTRQSQVPVTKSAIVDGRLAYYLPIGAFAGHWVGATSGLLVTGQAPVKDDTVVAASHTEMPVITAQIDSMSQPLGKVSFVETTTGAFFAANATDVTLVLSDGTFTAGVTPTITAPTGYEVTSATVPATDGSDTYTFQMDVPATLTAATVSISGLKLDAPGTAQAVTMDADTAQRNVAPIFAARVLDFAARTGGSNRDATAAALFNETFGFLSGRIGEDVVSDVVLSSGADFPDAMSASYLAGQLGTGTLLTAPTALSSQARSAILSSFVDTVYITGQTGAVSLAVQNEIEAMHVHGDSTKAFIVVNRLGGANRYLTNKAINEDTLVPSDTVLLATGEDFPDALALGPIAYRNTFPLILTRGKTLGANEIAQLGDFNPTKVIIAGGVGVVSPAIATDLAARGYTVTRLWGTDRTLTAQAVASWATLTTTAAQNFDSFETYIARGDDFADALAAGPVAGINQNVVVLTKTLTTLGVGIPGYLDTKVVGTEYDQVGTLHALGQTGAVSVAIMKAAAATVGLK